MSIKPELKKALEQSELTYEELRAFESGLLMLTEEEQEQFAYTITETPELIYPLYINFKAKLHAATGSEEEWENVIEQEIQELEEMINKRRVGNEVK